MNGYFFFERRTICHVRQADTSNAWIRRVYSNGTIVVVAGNHTTAIGSNGRPGRMPRKKL